MRKTKGGKGDREAKTNGVDRRQFGKVLAGGVGGLALAAGAATQKDSPAQPAVRSSGNTESTTLRTRSAVIVGAGLSGLIAARQLLQAGWTVTVLEANDRIGGRMFGRPTTGGGYLDFGGQWVGETQYEMQALVAELGISPFLSYEKGRSVRLYGGARSTFDGDVSRLLRGECKEYERPHDASRCEQTGLGPCAQNLPEGRVWKRVTDMSQTVIPDRPWATFNAKTLDTTNFGVSLTRWGNDEKMPDSPPWIPTMQSRIGGAGGFEPRDVSELHMAWTQRVGPQSETPEKWLLCGGAGQIPKRLADQFPPNTVQLNMPVTTIEQTEQGMVVTASGLLGTLPFVATYRARVVIVAIPPALRQKITFVNVPTIGKYLEFSKGAPMGSMAKVHAVYDRAFWRDECLSGSSAGKLGPGADDPKLCQFVADSSNPSATPGILTSFIAADTNKALTRELEEHQPRYTDREMQCIVKERVLDDFYRYFRDPRIKTDVKDFVYYNWDTKEWTGGAFTCYVKPGVWTSCGEVGWREPVGDIFWAGTETADSWPGYFDGAVRAGKAAAARVLAKWSWPTGDAKGCSPLTAGVSPLVCGS